MREVPWGAQDVSHTLFTTPREGVPRCPASVPCAAPPRCRPAPGRRAPCSLAGAAASRGARHLCSGARRPGCRRPRRSRHPGAGLVPGRHRAQARALPRWSTVLPHDRRGVQRRPTVRRSTGRPAPTSRSARPARRSSCSPRRPPTRPAAARRSCACASCSPAGRAEHDLHRDAPVRDGDGSRPTRPGGGRSTRRHRVHPRPVPELRRRPLRRGRAVPDVGAGWWRTAPRLRRRQRHAAHRDRRNERQQLHRQRAWRRHDRPVHGRRQARRPARARLPRPRRPRFRQPGAWHADRPAAARRSRASASPTRPAPPTWPCRPSA